MSRICVTCYQEKYFEKLACFSRPKNVVPKTTKSPQIHHEKTTKTPPKNTHFSQNPLQNAIQGAEKIIE
jgi:hypothetical protein